MVYVVTDLIDFGHFNVHHLKVILSLLRLQTVTRSIRHHMPNFSSAVFHVMPVGKNVRMEGFLTILVTKQNFLSAFMYNGLEKKIDVIQKSRSIYCSGHRMKDLIQKQDNLPFHRTMSICRSAL